MKRIKKEPLKEGMYFVYALCHNENVFYVGKSQNVLKRYQQHINKNNRTKVGVFVQQLINAGCLPSLHIITYTNELHAYHIEETLIKCLSHAGHKLYNNQCFRKSAQMPQNFDFTTRKLAFKTIIEFQNNYLSHKFGGYYLVTSIKGCDK